MIQRGKRGRGSVAVELGAITPALFGAIHRLIGHRQHPVDALHRRIASRDAQTQAQAHRTTWANSTRISSPTGWP